MAETTPKPGGIFPETRWSLLVRARSNDENERRVAFDHITAAYWKPVYKYIRAKWNKPREDAEDLTQEFFARVIEKDFLAGYKPAKAKLRTFLRTCVDALVQNERRAAGALKRGGGAVALSVDFELAESELHLSGLTSTDHPESFFEREWKRSVFGMALDRFRAECLRRNKMTHLRLFERYDLNEDDEPVSYTGLSAEFGIPVTDVTNYLAFARREFRQITLAVLHEMTATEEEFRREARALLR